MAKFDNEGGIIDLSGASIIKGLNAKDDIIKDFKIKGLDLKLGSLTNVQVKNITIIGRSFFDEFWFKNVSIYDSFLENVNIFHSSLEEVLFKDVTFDNVDFSYCNKFKKVSFFSCKFVNCLFKDIHFLDCKFVDCDFEKQKFTICELEDVKGIKVLTKNQTYERNQFTLIKHDNGKSLQIGSLDVKALDEWKEYFKDESNKDKYSFKKDKEYFNKYLKEFEKF